MKTTRLFFYTADMMRISGKGERASRRYLQKMRDFFKLSDHQELTLHHVSEFLKIPVDQLFPYIRMFPLLILTRL